MIEKNIPFGYPRRDLLDGSLDFTFLASMVLGTQPDVVCSSSLFDSVACGARRDWQTRQGEQVDLDEVEDLAAGTYRLGVFVDADSEIAEPNEGNNAILCSR